MDDLNKQITHRLQEVAECEFKFLSPLMDVGSYTANEVFEHFDSIRKNKEECMKQELKQAKSGGKKYDKNEIENLMSKCRNEMLSPECMEVINVSIDTFSCSFPRYILFKMLHKFERLASIPTKLKKKFIRQANHNKPADISFLVEITKPMLSLIKTTSTDEQRKALMHIALDYINGYIVSTNGYILSVMKADYQNINVSDDEKKQPILISPKTFKNCQGLLNVSLYKNDGGVSNKYCFQSENGGYYEELLEPLYYAQWKSAIYKELFQDGRVTLSKDSMKQMKSFANSEKKNCIDNRFWLEAREQNITLKYHNRSTDKIIQQVIKPENTIRDFTIAFQCEFITCMDDWNGTMWISGSSKPVIFDRTNPDDLYLVMPKALPDGMYNVHDFVGGTKISLESRASEYRKQEPLQKQTKQKTDSNNNQNPKLMSASKTSKKKIYHIGAFADGTFEIRGDRDSDLVKFIRTAAHFIRSDEDMQPEFVAYFNEQFVGTDWRSAYPLEEMRIAEIFESFLASKGIEEIPDVELDYEQTEAEQPIEEPTEEPTTEEDEIETVEYEEVVEEETAKPEATIVPMAINTEIVPTLELETEDGTLVIAGESYFHKLYDEEIGCFRSIEAEEKFNAIDAFIPDELISAEELDYEKIAEAVEAFMEQVEEA